MHRFKGFKYAGSTSAISELAKDDSTKIVVGVLGRSVGPDCSKLDGLEIVQALNERGVIEGVDEGDITIFRSDLEDILYLHFKTSFDTEIFLNELETEDFEFFTDFYSNVRSKFGRYLLLALQVCHMVLISEPGPVFDASYLTLFKSLKIVREKYLLKFLPKMLKSIPAAQCLGKEGRLCAPRVLFAFESQLQVCESELEIVELVDEMEEHIFKLLRSEFIITNNSSMSLFSVSRQKRFVHFCDRRRETPGLLDSSFDLLFKLIDGVQVEPPKTETKGTLVSMVQDHVHEALQFGFDDNLSTKYRVKSHFTTPSVSVWFECFRTLHRIFVEGPLSGDFDASIPDYTAFIANFHEIVDIDSKFFDECCQRGFDFGIAAYNDALPHHFSSVYHEQKKSEALLVFASYARGASFELYKEKLRELCESIWLSGKQQCEFPSLRGNPCIMQKHDVGEHSSGVVFVSACNCGKIQGNRADPYSVIQANFEFFQTLAMNCPNCPKVERFRFPIFEPSINNFTAANLINKPLTFDRESTGTPELSQKTQSQENLSLQENISSEGAKSEKGEEDEEKLSLDNNEIVIKIGESLDKEESLRLVSTTEYLPSMIQATSPEGLLPQFPSFSLVCIGASSIYSHNTGLPEHTQSGFMSGSNFLLPWEVNVRLEHAQSWAQNYEKSRTRRRHGGPPTKDGTNFNLKIFVGCEYECPRGHRFMLNSPTEIMRTGTVITRDSGSKLVFSDMPLYFPCVCRSQKPPVAQLMRVHIVTPKAPVNVIIEPKVKPGNKSCNFVFTTGVSDPIKLSQSAYWILRLPYVYQTEEGMIPPPLEGVTPETAANFGCLLSGMYGIKESEGDE